MKTSKRKREKTSRPGRAVTCVCTKKIDLREKADHNITERIRNKEKGGRQEEKEYNENGKKCII